MKHIKEINELFGTIRKAFNKDESTANGIYNKLCTDDSIEVDDRKNGELSVNDILCTKYFFNIDDFFIRSVSEFALSDTDYELYVDNVKMDTSRYINKKIFKKCEEIFNRPKIKLEKEKEEDDKYIKKDAKFNFKKYEGKIYESFLPQDKKRAIDIILSYIHKNSDITFYEYDETWHIQKKDVFLDGQLFLSLKSSKGIRFNWKNGDLNSQIHSIDMWEDFKFETNPDFTLNIGSNSINSNLPEILSFIKNPSSNINEELEGYDPKEELIAATKRLGRLKSPKSIDAQKRIIARLTAAIAFDEKADIDSNKIVIDDDLKIDVFKSIELYTIQVARGKSNSLIVSGDPGVGKTQVIKDTLSSLGMEKDKHYYFITGTTTTAGLYEAAFKNRNKLLVFDDCDAVFKEADSVNILKGLLDTYDVREVSKLTKGNTFDSMGMNDVEVQEEYDSTGKLPNKFEFTGQVIFISNLHEDKFDDALLSRSLHVDVHLNKEELYERMSVIMKRLCPDVDMQKKSEALEYLTFITNNYPTKFDLNIRTLIHAINLRSNNEEIMKIGNKEEFVWKLLIKKYLIRTR